MKLTPYRIETPRLVLRSWSPEDSEVVKRAEDESRDHLWGFMPWAAAGPQPLEEVIAKLRRFRANFDGNTDFMYGAFDRATNVVVGGCGLHERVGAGGVEIGYWTHVAWTKRGIATEMAAALTRVAFEVGAVRFVEIRCAKTNTTSARVPPKLGFSHEATLRERIELPRPGRPSGTGVFDDVLVFSMLARDYDASTAKSFPTSAYDAAHRKAL
jgi:RimJ/RimL family protein N-acetyltransferase